MSVALVTPLKWATPAEWVEAVATDTLALLSDHAHCELKAAASAQSLIVKNTQRPELVRRLLSIAHEELDHFGRDDGVAITGDVTRSAARWRQRDSLAELDGRYVRLAFHLRNAKLYSFWIE